MDEYRIAKDLDYLKNKAAIVFVIDHARAGNGFFKRIFDTHEEVLSITKVAYLYSHMQNCFGSNNRLDGSEVYDWIYSYTNVSMLKPNLGNNIEKSINRIGDNVANDVDAELMDDVLVKLIKNRQIFMNAKEF